MSQRSSAGHHSLGPYDRGVLRPSSLPHALAAVATAFVVVLTGAVAGTMAGVGPAGATAAATARPADPEQPLVPRIRTITPDYVPDHGPIVITGTVTNVSDQTWTSINVHGFMGTTAMTTTEELSEATRTPVESYVGNRITVPGTFASINSLAPGEQASFTVRLPQRTLPVTTPGVYWFGVHVLGDDGQGGPREAVGRDRTFIPYVPEGALGAGAQEEAALILPLRAAITRAADGSVLDPEEWRASLRSGALRAVVDTGRAAHGRPLNWLIDPAVPDVVRRLAHGNPARTLIAPPSTSDQGPSTSPSPSETASASGSASGSSATSAADEAPAATARVARRWLRHLRPLLASATSELLGLPYGDLAVDSAARNDTTLLPQAFRRTSHGLNPWDLPLSPVVAPPSGRIAAESMPDIPRDADVLLSDDGVQDARSVVNRVGVHQVLLTSSGAREGGPGPAPPGSSIALRQRILAEAALRVLGDQQPLVVQLPDPTSHALRPSFFSGLDVPWLRLTTLDAATAVTATPLEATALREPAAEDDQLSAGLYSTAEDVLSSGTTLQSVLPDNQVLRKRLFEEVTGNASYDAAVTPYLALARMRETDRWVHSKLDAISLAAPQSVTLASSSGRFSALVSNELDVPVKVKVVAQAEHGLTISGGETVQLPPHGRQTVLLNASADERGVYNVRLELTNDNGVPLGAFDAFPMRAEQVSRLIWVIIGVGVALLFTAIGVRLTRRIISARAGRRSSL
jgi:hypothetical protein